MTKSFEQPSYLTQVRRLRALAVEVAKLYPFKIKALEFIKYSANAIFKITDTQNKQYVLRIAPIELASVSTTSFPLKKPVFLGL